MTTAKKAAAKPAVKPDEEPQETHVPRIRVVGYIPVDRLPLIYTNPQTDSGLSQMGEDFLMLRKNELEHPDWYVGNLYDVTFTLEA